MSYTLIKDLGNKEYTNSLGVTTVKHMGLFACDNCGYQKEMPFHTASSFKKSKTCNKCYGKYGDTLENRKHLKIVWKGMKQRCYNPNNAKYYRYGAGGIKICDRWLDFENFFNDNKDSYKLGLSIDRIDVNKGYYPENVQWIPFGENTAKEKRKAVAQYKIKNDIFHTIEKEPIAIFRSVAEAALKLSLNSQDIINVCNGKGWTVGGYFWRYVNSNKEFPERIGNKAEKKINQYAYNKKTGEFTFIKTWDSIKLACKSVSPTGTKAGSTNIIKVCQGKRKTALGYYWEYAEV